MDASALVGDAIAISRRWLDELDLDELVRARIADAGLIDASVDVVAVGKASREMLAALQRTPGVTVRRRLVIVDAGSELTGHLDEDRDVVVAEHPIPGSGSLRAGSRVLDFLDEATSAECTIFLISGGASSLCVAPVAPLTLEDLRGLWDAAVSTGADITTLNQLRASCSMVSGGAVLGHVRSPRSLSLVLVDNVVSGMRWVASGFTFPYDPDAAEVSALLARVGLVGTPLGERLTDAARLRSDSLQPLTTRHENVALCEPAMMLRATVAEAERRSYRVIDLGADIQGDVNDVVATWGEILERESGDGPICVVGVGEVTVRVKGAGRGGRCQEFAWRMGEQLPRLDRVAVALARASDGRDFLEGVGGAWSDETTVSRAAAKGIDWRVVAENHDTHPALESLGQLIEGGHTGWNLCDLYLALS